MKRGTSVTIIQHESENIVGQQGVITAAHCISGSVHYHVKTEVATYYCSVRQLKINN